MRPTLPCRWFDLCLVPRHDLRRAVAPGSKLIPTIGAVNRVQWQPGEPKSDRLVLLGGPSTAHAWNDAAVFGALAALWSGDTGPAGWHVADSRRTPFGFLGRVADAFPGAAAHPHGTTGPDWLASALATAAEVWVTEDSVSMVYEALTAGARVGILPLPRRREHSRVVRGLEQLAADGYVTPWAEWRESRVLRTPPGRLAEADRCAALIVERWFHA